METEKIDWTKYKFHPSRLGDIMTPSKVKDQLGETCKKHLLECFIRERYGRDKKIVNKYMAKGLVVEEDSITLYARATKRFLTKNEQQIENEWFIGTPDLFDGTEIMKAILVEDIKSSWSLHTFLETVSQPIKKEYKWQLHGYGDITGAKKLKLVYCLINTPEALINKEKESLKYKMGVIDPQIHPEYMAACRAIDHEMIFDDIPLEKRCIAYEIERNDNDIELAHKQVMVCREFLTALDNAN